MAIRPILTIDGVDASKYFLKCHMEQTANQAKDPGKYDLLLANINGWGYGAFGTSAAEQLQNQAAPTSLYPKIRVFLSVENDRRRCKNDGTSTGTPEEITIFRGEIQKAECDEVYVRIEGSCTEGGMSAAVTVDKSWPGGGHSNRDIIKDILEMFGYTGVAHIYPYNNTPPDHLPKIESNLDFDTAMNIVCLSWAQSIYFFDEDDEFWCVPPVGLRGISDLNGVVIRGTSGRSAVGFCTVVRVIGGAPHGTDPEDIASVLKNQQVVEAEARADQEIIDSYGEINAPTVFVPNCDQDECQDIADRLLQWYLQYKDVPQVSIAGEAPGLLSKVKYYPYNKSLPPSSCNNPDYTTATGNVIGLVTRRVVDISAEGGFVCQLDVATNFLDAGVIDYSGATGIYDDPKVVNPYPGVTFPPDRGDVVLLDSDLYETGINLVGEPGEGEFLMYNPSTEEFARTDAINRNAMTYDGYYEAHENGGEY